MFIKDSFTPAFRGLNDVDQTVELARLRTFAERVSTPEAREYVNNHLHCPNQAAWEHIHERFTQYVIGNTILRLLDIDLLGHGRLVDGGVVKEGFGVLRLSWPALEYVHRRILSEDYISGMLLILVLHGCMIFDLNDRTGEIDFSFTLLQDRTEAAERIVEALPSDDEVEARALLN